MRRPAVSRWGRLGADCLGSQPSPPARAHLKCSRSRFQHHHVQPRLSVGKPVKPIGEDQVGFVGDFQHLLDLWLAVASRAGQDFEVV